MTTQAEKDSDTSTTKMVDGNSAVQFDDDGVDGELIEDGEEEDEVQIVGKSNTNNSSKKKDNVSVKKSDSKSDKDLSSNESPRKRKNSISSSEHRKHHQHHHHHHHHHHSHSSEEPSKKRHRSSHSGEEEDDGDRGSRRSNRQSTRSDRGSVSSRSGRRRSRSRDRKYSNNNKHSSSQSQHRNRSQSKSRSSTSKEKDHRSSEESPSPVPPRSTKKTENQRKKESSATAVESAEAEDGEILEDGELSDDDDDTTQTPVVTDSSREDLRTSPVKSSRRDDKREKNSSRDNRDRRKDDEKKKHKKYVDLDKTDREEDYNIGSGGGGNSSAGTPAWGSGYQGVGKKAKTSPVPGQQGSGLLSPFGKSMKGGRNNNKGSASPPGLYDSPSYSEDSEPEESMTKSFGMLADGYMDASVAADEKEGIFKRNGSVKNKKKKRGDRSLGKRKNTDYNKGDEPAAKKAAAERPICKFYRDGKCSKGVGCTFNHDVEQNKRMEVCKYHMSVKGCHKEKCLYMHDFPCKYYHTGQQCFSGDRCKFSHDALTEDTRRALEMRVAAEDIIDMEDSDYEYDYEGRHDRRYESRGGRPSLLGSPPRRHPDLKKIPSLFDIETHPPMKSPKPSPQPQRPSGFYSETNQSPKPGNSGGPQLSPTPPNNNNNNNTNVNNMGMIRPGGPQLPAGGMMRAPGPAAAAGLIAAVGAAAGNRVPFNGNQAAPGNNPVLNMLGAIISQAQKVAPAMMNAMASSLNSNINNMGNNMNNNSGGMFGPMGQMMMSNNNNPGNNNRMNKNMNNNNNVPSSMNQNIIGSGMEDSAGSSMQQQQQLDMGMNSDGMDVDMRDVDYRIQGPPPPLPPSVAEAATPFIENSMTEGESDEKSGDKSVLVDDDLEANFDESEDGSRDLSELDQIRRRIQAQIDSEVVEDEDEDDNNEEDDEGKLSVALDMAENDGGLSPEHRQEEDKKEPELKQEMQQQPEVNLTQEDVEKIEVPAHLPKKQRELFMRIQQQHLLREKQKEQQEALKASEAEMKVEKDDWYSDSDDDTSEATDGNSTRPSKIKATVSSSPTVINEPAMSRRTPSLSPPPPAATIPPSLPSSISSAFPLLTSMAAAVSSSKSSSSPPSSSQSSTSTINIMQMINAIRKQTSNTAKDKTSAVPETPGQADHSIETSSPASPPPLPSSDRPKPPPPVDPPVVSATPKIPLVYAIVRIALDMPKIYTVLPADMNVSDSKYRYDPRVKKHFELVNKQPNFQSSSPTVPVPASPKENQLERKLSTEEKEKLPPTKPVDPRLNKRQPSGDPRLQKASAGSSPRLEDPRLDPRLKNSSVNQQPQQKPVDAILAKRVSGPMDPRLNRQMSQEPMMGGGMGGPMGGHNNNMSGPGPMNMNNPMSGNMMGSGGMMPGSNNSVGGGRPPFQGIMGNNNMGMGGPLNRMGGPMMGNMNNFMMGGPQGNNMMGGPQGNNMMGGPQGNNMMGGPQGSNMMGGPQGNNMMGGPQGNNMGGPQQGNMQGSNMDSPQMNKNNMMGGPPSNMMSGPQGNMMGGNRGPMGMNNHPMDRMGAGPARGFDNFESSPNSEMNMNDPRLGSRPVSNNPADPRGGLSNNMNTTDPRLRRDPRSGQGDLRDPRSAQGDPRDPRSAHGDPRDPRSAHGDPRGLRPMQGDPRGPRSAHGDPRDPRASHGDPRDPRSAQGDPRDPRSAHGDPRDPRSAHGDPRSMRRNSAQPGGGGGSPNNFQMGLSSSSSNTNTDNDSTSTSQMSGGLPPLPPLSLSASLPPLPSLSPPSLPPQPASNNPAGSSPKDSDFSGSTNDNKPTTKKFDYRNDPRFKRVKRSGQRKSSMDYSSPLGVQEDNEGTKASAGSGSPQYNGYNRPKPSTPTPPPTGNVHARRQNAPSPSLPDTLQDFDLPELPVPQQGEATEPDLKVKDLFKTFDPTASPFC